MSRLDRYIFTECLGPIGTGFFAATSLLLVSSFFRLAEAMIRRDVPLSTVGKLLALNLPHIVVLTIPMAILFGILVAVGRLAADSELTALRAAGVSLLYLYRPVLMLSVLFMVLNSYLMIQVLPWGNRTLARLTDAEFLRGSQAHQVEPRIFHEILDGKTLYVFELGEDDTWRGVFISDSVPYPEMNYTVAEAGDIRIEEGGRRVIVSLDEALDQSLDLREPKEAKIFRYGSLEMFLEETGPGAVARSTSRGVRELTLTELHAVANDSTRSLVIRNRARVEIHKKFSIPAVCVVFGLLALPLGFNRRAGGTSPAFVQALAVLIAYYVFQSIGEEAAAEGKIRPWVSMWLPNAVFLLAGAFLLGRRNEDKPLLWARFDRWIREHSWRIMGAWRRPRKVRKHRVAASESPQHRFLLHLPRISLRFPGRLDRYVLSIFGRTGVLVLAVCISLYIIVDLADLASHILKNDISMRLVIEYYAYYSLQIFYSVAPLAILLTTLIVFGVLSRWSEITAAKAIGISLYRLAVPALVAGILLATATALLDFTVLPAANSRQVELRAFIKGAPLAEGRRRVSQQWYFSPSADGGSFIYYYLPNPDPTTFHSFQALRFDSDHHLTGHLYARELRYADDRWVMSEGWARSFHANKLVDYREIDRPQIVDLQQGPEFFSTEIKSSQEMNYWELKAYVNRLEQSGQPVPELKIQIYNKLAMPIVSVVMVLVALPFSFRLGKRGALSGIAIALFVGVVLFAVLAIFTTLGEAEMIPPMVAAWSPNVLFSLLSMYLFLGIRS